jgi:hypothetical protein
MEDFPYKSKENFSMFRILTRVTLARVTLARVTLARVTLACTVWAPSAYGFDSSGSNSKKVEAKKFDNSQVSFPSASVRRDATVSAGVELYFGFGALIGYHLDEEQVVEVWFDKPLYVNLGCVTDYNESSFFGGRYRRFFGNSFNVSIVPYVFLERAKYTCSFDRFSGADEEDVKDARLQTTNLGMGVSLGNRWNWKHFYIGGEWVGLGYHQTVATKRSGNSRGIEHWSFRPVVSRLTLGVTF